MSARSKVHDKTLNDKNKKDNKEARRSKSTMMNHKGYIGRVEFDSQASIFFGEVINTRDSITFQGSSVEELKQAFVDSVDDYLEFCEERGEQPDKPFSGKLVLRMPPELHQQAYIKAKESGMSLNEWVNYAIQKEV